MVPKDVKFIVPEITCNDKQEIWYHEPEDTKDTRMTNTFNCEVKKTSHCRSIQRPDCKQITWNECREAPVKKCNYKKVHLPTQELLHRKKCLLPDAKPESAGKCKCLYQGYNQRRSRILLDNLMLSYLLDFRTCFYYLNPFFCYVLNSHDTQL